MIMAKAPWPSSRKTALHHERYYPHARIRVFHHSGPEIPGSAREGKPRSFFLCFRFAIVHQSDPRNACPSTSTKAPAHTYVRVLLNSLELLNTGRNSFD